MKQSREFMVGLFVAAGIVLFAIFVFSLKSFSGPLRTVNVEFSYVDGLGADAPVQYAGYRVGKVESVKILPGAATRLITRLTVPKDLPITRTSEVIITSMGMMGEKVVEILPSAGGDPLGEGETIRGTDPVLMSRIFDQVRSMFDESTAGNIRQISQNVLKATEDLSVFTATMRKISEERGGDVSKMIADAAEGARHLPGLLKNAEEATDKIDRAAAALTALADSLKGVAAENRPEVQGMIKNLNATSANLKALSDDVRRHPWKLIRK